MSLVHADSFDGYTDLSKKGWTAQRSGGNPPTAGSAGKGRNGTAALFNGNDARNGAFRPIPAAATNWVCVAFQFDRTGIGTVIASFRDSGTNQIEVRLTSTGFLQITRNGVFLAQGSTHLSINTLYHIDFTATIDDTAGSYNLKLNGVVELSASSVDTKATANAYANEVALGCAGDGNVMSVYWDDFVCGNDQGSVNTTSPGDCRVEMRHPSGAGTTTQWTPSAGANWQCVDDATPNDDTDYVASATVGDKDTYAMEDITPVSGTIVGMVLNIHCRKDDAGTRKIQSVVRTGAVEENSADLTVLDTYATLLDVRETKPGGGAFSIADVNGSEIGVELTA